MGRVQYPSRMGKSGLSKIAVTFPTNNTSDPDSTKIYASEGVTIAYSATGKYTLTFKRPFMEQYGAIAKLRMGTIAGNYANVDSLSLSTNGVMVVVIGTYNSSNAAAAIAADAQSWVSLDMTVKE